MAATARAQPRPRRGAEESPRRAPSKPVAAPRKQPRRAARPRLAGGVVWIAIVAALLAGIVALNVAALRLNLEVERLDDRKAKLVAENAAAASELSSLAASARIEAIARRKLGLGPPAETTYVPLAPKSR